MTVRPPETAGGAARDSTRRVSLTVKGIVQGVGFRPFLFRLASRLCITGWCVNSGGEVRLEIQSTAGAIGAFLELLVSELPPAASIESVTTSEIPAVSSERAFVILPSEERALEPGGLSPDLAPCPACLAEMRDPSSRRRGYALLSCSDCGPRYSVSTGLPYDRALTTMAPYPLCSACEREYLDPSDRRFHAEPLACPVCGPPLRLVTAGGGSREGDPVADAAGILHRGGVVAVKGAGGYLLAANACDDAVLERVRRSKNRPWKPLAVMVGDLASAAGLVLLDGASAEALCSPAAPIVIARARPGSRLSRLVAPGMSTIGVMLPSTPLQQMLLDAFDGPLVMTSGNDAEDPIITEDSDALSSLDADSFIMHDRRIEGALDDSVVIPPIIVRRSRGFVPRIVKAAFNTPVPIVAAGADQSATFALMRNDRLLPGRPIGDLDGPAAARTWRVELDRMLSQYGVDRAVVAADLHPGYRSRALAEELAGSRGWKVFVVQHHFAHMCSVMLEHGLDPSAKAVGLILDGTGYGPDGSIWGCEMLEGGLEGYRRAGHLKQVPMPGGEAAVREPRRMAASHLRSAGLVHDWPALDQVMDSRSLSPLTSSAGRLFDAAAYVLGICPPRVSCQAEAAMLLESAADPEETLSFDMDVDSSFVIDPSRAFERLLDGSIPVPARAAGFHNGLAGALCRAATGILDGRDLPVVLAGGCWANTLLLRAVRSGLEGAGLDVMFGRELPVGDGAVAAGQAAAVAAMLPVGRERAV